MTGVLAGSLSLRDRLASIVADVLRIPVDMVTPDSSFAGLGMDSLAAVELTVAIEDAIGAELPLSAVHECPTLASLCSFIEHGPGSTSSAQRDRMLADAILPAEIVPGLDLACRTRDARNLLLTGATGFVGAFLLRAITDESNADIHCLVRDRGGDPRRRLREHLERYALWTDDLEARVHIVVGDLAAPRLGLSARAFADLVRDVDAIYHAAADVNWVSGYDALRATNVLGTVEILRLACAGSPKPMHFLSSVSVCHTMLAPKSVDETFDALPSIDGLWMGYAQSKCVAESLVREAGARGLPVTIMRPSLVTGERAHGRSNPDDLVSRFIAGCIAMRAAPDLDWRMDCVPSDDLAAAVVRLACNHGDGITTSHITATTPRHWRECVLWMRLSGYGVELVPYREWMQMLHEIGADNPLHALRPFFTRTIAAEDHLTLPELFEESRRTSVNDSHTRAILSTLGIVPTALDSNLLSRYFGDFERHDLVPRVSSRRRSSPNEPELPLIEPLLPTIATSLGEWLDDESLAITSVRLKPIKSDDSIVAELTAWHGGTRAGLYSATVSVASRRTAVRDIQLFVKSKPADADVIAVAEAVADLASAPLGQMVRHFRDHLGFTSSHRREVALYADSDARLRAHTPRVAATQSDDDRPQWLVVLESIDTRSASSVTPWDDTTIDAALRGLARIHSTGLERFAELESATWQSPKRDLDQRVAMLPLWSALADHAFEHSSAWKDSQLQHIHARLVADVASWARPLDNGPRTLIHNDFNPRNLVVHERDGELRLCAFDWELATIGLPQRDLAEFLSFVLPEGSSRAVVARWIERYRSLLEQESGQSLHRGEWDYGFRAALCDLLVDRLASYAMVDRIRRQSFLPRVVRGWSHLNRYYPWPG